MSKPEGSSVKLALQIAVAIGGIVPVFGGFAGMVLGSSLLGDASGSPGLDSHIRYLSGLLFGIGLAFWSTIPGIEHKGKLFRLLTGFVVLGGLGRLSGIVFYGLPGTPMLAALIMELVVTPLLCLWQARLAAAQATRLVFDR
jgi:hypothetical protein